MSPFTPADGVRARWRQIYDLMAKAEAGEVVTYEAMGEVTGLDPETERHKIQVASRRAAQELLKINLRSVESAPNAGYRIAETPRKLEIATRHQSKARRSVRRGRDQVTYVDLSEVDDATRAIFEAMSWKFAEQDEAIRRLDVRAQRHERQLQAAASSQEHTDTQLADLQARLAKLEAERNEEAGGSE